MQTAVNGRVDQAWPQERARCFHFGGASLHSAAIPRRCAFWSKTAVVLLTHKPTKTDDPLEAGFTVRYAPRGATFNNCSFIKAAISGAAKPEKNVRGNRRKLGAHFAAGSRLPAHAPVGLATPPLPPSSPHGRGAFGPSCVRVLAVPRRKES